MESIGWLVALIGVLVTILIFVMGLFNTKSKDNETEIKDVKKELDAHKLHTAKEFSTKDEMIKMIGLISAPIQKSVEDLTERLSSFENEQRDENKGLHVKLDELLSRWNRRKDDD